MRLVTNEQWMDGSICMGHIGWAGLGWTGLDWAVLATTTTTEYRIPGVIELGASPRSAFCFGMGRNSKGKWNGRTDNDHRWVDSSTQFHSIYVQNDVMREYERYKVNK